MAVMLELMMELDFLQNPGNCVYRILLAGITHVVYITGSVAVQFSDCCEERVFCSLILFKDHAKALAFERAGI